jgi:hypothetical protein
VTAYGWLTTILVAFFVMYAGFMIEQRERLPLRPAGLLGYILGGLVILTGALWQVHV